MERVGLTAWVMALLMLPSIWAGEIQTCQWPSYWDAMVEAAAIPVVMDIPIHVSVEGNPILLRQIGPATYSGCTPLRVQCNANVQLSASIIPTGAVKGNYSCSLLNWSIDTPGGVAVLCAKLENPELAAKSFARVANIKVLIAPR